MVYGARPRSVYRHPFGDKMFFLFFADEPRTGVGGDIPFVFFVLFLVEWMVSCIAGVLVEHVLSRPDIPWCCARFPCHLSQVICRVGAVFPGFVGWLGNWVSAQARSMVLLLYNCWWMPVYGGSTMVPKLRRSFTGLGEMVGVSHPLKGSLHGIVSAVVGINSAGRNRSLRASIFYAHFKKFLQSNCVNAVRSVAFDAH